jgi:hypothetical protein
MLPVGRQGMKSEMRRQRVDPDPKVARIAPPGVVAGNTRFVGAFNGKDGQDEKLRQTQRF